MFTNLKCIKQKILIRNITKYNKCLFINSFVIFLINKLIFN